MHQLSVQLILMIPLMSWLCFFFAFGLLTKRTPIVGPSGYTSSNNRQTLLWCDTMTLSSQDMEILTSTHQEPDEGEITYPR
jgi:hypothetical protein